MNKTLLLILCDFLLLTLLALTRWEAAEPPRPRQPPVPELAANAVTKDQDLVATMRESLADEKAVRDELAQKLSTADAALAAREQSLTQVQSERARLAEPHRFRDFVEHDVRRARGHRRDQHETENEK